LAKRDEFAKFGLLGVSAKRVQPLLIAGVSVVGVKT
jgi:hypothetical protein